MKSADRKSPDLERTLPLEFSKGPGGALETKGGPDLNAQLDDITLLACALCQAPVGLVCSRDQQGWRLSHNFGAEDEPLSFDLAFYTFAVTQRRAFEIADLRGDPAFAMSPLVTGAPHYRAFAGIPVTSEEGQLLGAICILDTKARTLTGPQRQGLEALARQVRSHLQYQQMMAAQKHEQGLAREQQRQWRRVFECASLGMAEVTPEGEWEQVNGSFCAILGYSENEMMRTRPRDVLHPDDVPSGVALLRKTLAGELPSCAGEKRLLHKTGKIVWCSIHVTLVRDAAGEPAHFLAQVIDISEMRVAQEGWRNAELHAKAILELPAPVGIITTDARGGVTYVNRFAEQLCGYTVDELRERSMVSIFLESELREHSQELARLLGAITKGVEIILEHARVTGPETREWTWLRKDGSAARVTVTVSPVKDTRGEISAFAIAATPVAKAVEDGGVTVDRRFRTIADSAPLGMFLTDAHGDCTYVNEMFHHITGMGMAEANGQGWYGVFRPEDRNSFHGEFQKALRRGSDFCMELRLARQGAGWVRVRGREIFFEDVAQGFVCTVEDINATHELLESLKLGEEKLRTMVTNAPFPLVLLDRERKCVMASVGWLELHHSLWNEVNSRNVFERMPEARERLEDLCRRALNGASQLVHEQNVKIQEGHSEWLRWHLFPWRCGGEICGIGIFEERLTHHLRMIADADAARGAAEAASRVKSEFLAEVSGELKTPGAGILGLADMLLEQESNPQRREYLEMIKTSTGSWLKLAGELYDFSKMESRKVELEVLPFNLIDGLNQTMRRLSITAENKGLELVCQTSPDLPTVVVGDGGRLFQVVTHLVMFAIEITQKGEISVAVDLSESAETNPSLAGAVQFHFVVRDFSGWLTEEKLADIQQVLMMVENSPAIKKVGTNLGLVLSARLVHLMNGKLWVEREGKSAAFHFTAPLSGKRQSPSESALLKGSAVLVADDSTTHRRWLQNTLTAWGMKPTILEKPGAMMDVLEIAQEAGRPFRFVLLDAHIPDRDTFAFAAQIKANARTANVKPIMLLSPSLRVADESRARDLGLEHTLVKPVNANDLRELMEQIEGRAPEQTMVQPGKLIRNVLPVARWNVLLVDQSRFNQEVAMGVFGQQGHRIAIARNSKEALAILERRACDMVLIGLKGSDSLEILAAIRQQEKTSQKPVKVFVMTGDPGIAEREPALKEITDGFLPNPIQPKDLSLLLEQVKPELEQY